MGWIYKNIRLIKNITKYYKRRIEKMAKDREAPCLYYICAGQCKKGREAEHNGYCKHCDKYCPRAKVRHINKKKRSWIRLEGVKSMRIIDADKVI